MHPPKGDSPRYRVELQPDCQERYSRNNRKDGQRGGNFPRSVGALYPTLLDVSFMYLLVLLPLARLVDM